VLKGCDDPYLPSEECRSFIKLQKDYISGLGDTAKFVIVGDVGMEEVRKSLASYGRHHFTLDAWKMRMRSAAIMGSRDFAL
jgi:ATP-dependent DNA ligase